MNIGLVTGVGRREGIGFEVARQLGRQGFQVLLSARKLAQAEALARELTEEGLNVSAMQLDTTDASSVDHAVRTITQNYGKLDVLVNNAAIMGFTPVDDYRSDLETVRRHFETNLIGTWRISQEMFPLLKASGNGRIVNVSSSSGAFWDPDFGLVNNPGFQMAQFGNVSISSYALTKLATNGLTLKLAQDFRKANILVNSVCPGLVATREGSSGRPVKEGARGIVWAATLPEGGPTGLFFRDGKQLPW